MEPRAATVRVLSSLGYLPPVAIALLLMPRYRIVRHVRFHALQSLMLMGFMIGGAILLAWSGAILGNLPGIGFMLLSLCGLAISLWMLLMLGYAVYGAIAAYQGRTTRIPGVSRLLRVWERSLEKLLSLPSDPPKRRRKPASRS